MKHFCSVKPLSYLLRHNHVKSFSSNLVSSRSASRLMGFIDPATLVLNASTSRCLASLMQSIIASEMTGAVETTSSAAGLGGCSEVRSRGNGEVEKSWHCFSVTAQNTISGSQGPGINDLCLSATVAHCAGATDKKESSFPQHLAGGMP